MFFFQFEIFCEIHPPRHIKKKINLAPSDKSILANKLPSTNLEQFLSRIKSPKRSEREVYCALIVTNWPKCHSLNPQNFTKTITNKMFFFSNFSLAKQIILNDIKILRQKWLVKMSKIV